MQTIRKSLLVVIWLFVSGCSVTDGARTNESIEVKEANDSYSFSVPVGRLTMTLPKSDWSRKVKSIGGATNNPRYFYFEDKKEASLILSGWFEPDRLFKGIRSHWEEDTRSWKKQGLPAPVNISFERLGGWEAVMYDHNFGNAVSSHLRAHWVQSGTWIDLHLSTTTYMSSAENRKKLKSVLGGISITQKGGS